MSDESRSIEIVKTVKGEVEVSPVSPLAVRSIGTQAGGVHLPPKAVRHVGTQAGGVHMPPKAIRHVGTQAGGVHVAPKVASFLK